MQSNKNLHLPSISAETTPPDAVAFSGELRRLRARRNALVASLKQQPRNRSRLTEPERAEILRKAASRCHLCRRPPTRRPLFRGRGIG
jgi:hypothetical protein